MQGKKRKCRGFSSQRIKRMEKVSNFQFLLSLGDLMTDFSFLAICADLFIMYQISSLQKSFLSQLFSATAPIRPGVEHHSRVAVHYNKKFLLSCRPFVPVFLIPFTLSFLTLTLSGILSAGDDWECQKIIIQASSRAESVASRALWLMMKNSIANFHK